MRDPDKIVKAVPLTNRDWEQLAREPQERRGIPAHDADEQVRREKVRAA